MGVSLRPMTEEHYATWYGASVAHYAEAIRANGFSSDPDADAARQFQELLPDGLNTPGQHLFGIHDAQGLLVGTLWVAERRPMHMAFIYDIEIAAEHRRRGYAREALTALEAVVRGFGLSSIGLHVFGDNHGAIRLYEAAGYQVANLTMKKDLTGE